MWRTAAIIGVLFIATTAGAVSTEFTRPLKIGSTGSDVRALQIVLNSTAETRIAESGPGSPGQETTYFGNKTALAVSKYQVLHRSAILAPNGLSQGTGYVGPSTLAVLNKKSAPVVAAKTETLPAVPVTSPVEKPKLLGNVEGLQGTLSTIERVGLKQGFSSAEIERLKTIITKDITSTTTPLLATFVKQVQKDNPGQQPITLGDQLQNLALSFRDLFFPHEALAINASSIFSGSTPFDDPTLGAGGLIGFGTVNTPAVPFGGAIIGTPIWCLCTASWWIPITPLPPTMPEALMYMPGSQAYLNFNIPATLWLLGLYEPGPQCLIYDGDSCIPLPVQGLILPIVGSSLI